MNTKTDRIEDMLSDDDPSASGAQRALRIGTAGVLALTRIAEALEAQVELQRRMIASLGPPIPFTPSGGREGVRDAH